MATIRVCDLCNSQESVRRRQFVTGQNFNGTDYDSISENIDLCLNCEFEILKRAVTNLISNRECGTVSTARERLNAVMVEVYKQWSKKGNNEIFNYQKKLDEMLCYIHRDGGHYIGEHGIEKAYVGGLKKVLDLIHKDEENELSSM